MNTIAERAKSGRSLVRAITLVHDARRLTAEFDRDNPFVRTPDLETLLGQLETAYSNCRNARLCQALHVAIDQVGERI